MIINIDAFKKAENIINQAQDKLNGETAMRYLQTEMLLCNFKGFIHTLANGNGGHNNDEFCESVFAVQLINKMKLKFKNQDFQTDAVNAIVDLFAGQEKTRSTFSVVEEKQISLMNDLGIGNALPIFCFTCFLQRDAHFRDKIRFALTTNSLFHICAYACTTAQKLF